MKIVLALFLIVLLGCASSETKFIGKCTREIALEIAQNKFKRHNQLSEHSVDIKEDKFTYQILFSLKKDLVQEGVLQKGGGAKYVIAKNTCKIIDVEEYQ